MNRKITSDSMTPLYKQLSNTILEEIEKGKLKTGDKIPSENELMRTYHLSRVTVRNALARLTESGHLLKIQGKGTFVTTSGKHAEPLHKTIGYSVICEMQGLKPSAKVLSLRYEIASDEIALFFSLPLGSQIIALRRLRLASDTPVLIEYNAFKPSMTMLFQENMEQSLYEVLRKYGYESSLSSSSVSIHTANKEEALLLGIEPGIPLIQNSGRIFDAHSTPLHTCNQLVRTDKNTVFKFYV